MDKAQVLKAASVVLAYMGSLDPTWAERIKITKDEFGYDDLQTCGAYIANQLEQGLHTVIPRHPFFEPGFIPPSDKHICPVCEKPFQQSYPGQPICGNICAAAYYKSGKL